VALTQQQGDIQNYHDHYFSMTELDGLAYRELNLFQIALKSLGARSDTSNATKPLKQLGSSMSLQDMTTAVALGFEGPEVQ